jgi:hypothetical protein
LSQGIQAVGVGMYAGYNTQGAYAVAVGRESGGSNQGDSAVAIGNSAGNVSQSVNAVAIGKNAGETSQGASSVAVGREAGYTSQGLSSVAVGYAAGQTTQSGSATAIGASAGNNNQGLRATALGFGSGQVNQGDDAVAIGYAAAGVGQGANSIAIGNRAGQTNQAANGIIINSSGVAENSTAVGHIVLRSSQGYLTLNPVADTWTFSGGDVTVPNDKIVVGADNGVSADRIVGGNFSSQGAQIGKVSLSRSGSGYPVMGYNCHATTIVNTYSRQADDYASWAGFSLGGVQTFTTTATGTGNTSGVAGPYVARGGTDWTASSDRKFKENLEVIPYGLDAVSQLEPLVYDRNDREGVSEIGFVAQDVESVIPHVVTKNDEEEYGIQYARMVPVLVKAIQELKAEVEALKNA